MKLRVNKYGLIDDPRGGHAIFGEALTVTTCSTWFDYKNQAWVTDGAYVRCAHSTCDGKDYSGAVRCYGTVHAGEKPTKDIRRRYDPNYVAFCENPKPLEDW